MIIQDNTPIAFDAENAMPAECTGGFAPTDANASAFIDLSRGVLGGSQIEGV